MAWSAARIGGERRRNVGGDGGDETLAQPLVAPVGGEKREKQTQRFEERAGPFLSWARPVLFCLPSLGCCFFLLNNNPAFI
jgi:hypothetical protein